MRIPLSVLARHPFSLALALSLLAHAPLVMRPAPPAVAVSARAVAVRYQAPPQPTPSPAASPAAPERPPAAPRPPAPPPRGAPSAEQAEPPPAQGPDRVSPLLQLAGPAEWQYRLRQAGQDGEAVLRWQPAADGSYVLRLTRRIGERTLPALESLGHVGSAGLVPDRFALQRGGQDRQAINFDQEQARLSFSASPAQYELQAGTQDRLSWWLQLAALVQASPTPLEGARWRVWVAGLRGELREWTFELQEGGPGLHLRRLPLGPEDPGVELWLDPQRGFWPTRLRQGDPEKRGFEVWLNESAATP